MFASEEAEFALLHAEVFSVHNGAGALPLVLVPTHYCLFEYILLHSQRQCLSGQPCRACLSTPKGPHLHKRMTEKHLETRKHGRFWFNEATVLSLNPFNSYIADIKQAKLPTLSVLGITSGGEKVQS